MNRRFARLAALVASLPATALAEEAAAPAPEPPPAAPVAPSPAPASIVPDTPQAVPGARPIDAQTALRRALAANTSLAAVRLGTRQAAEDVLVEEGRYPFVFQADAGHTRTTSPLGTSGDRFRTSRSYDVGAAVRRTFPFGTSAEVRVEGQRFENEIPLGASVPGGASSVDGYGAAARLTVRQPLLRGAGTTVGEAGLRAARKSRVAQDKRERREESALARDVLFAYWDLWYADESLRIARAALELARAQERLASEQRATGALAPADVLVFSSRVAELEEGLVTTELQREERSLVLSRLMGEAPEAAPPLFASDSPVPGVSPSRQQIELALRSDSIELAALEAELALARTRAETAGETSRPLLDLEGFVETYGEDQRPLGALSRAGRFQWITAHAGAVFELPLDGTRYRAERESALLSVRIAEQNVKAARERIAADAVSAVARARAAESRLSLAERSVAVAEQTYEAARARFELGGGIAIEVQQAEEALSRARLSLAQTRVELVQAQIALQHLAGTLVPGRG